MRSSSAAQLELDYSGTEPRAGEGVQNLQHDAQRLMLDGGGGGSALFKAPDFAQSGKVYADTARIAGRLNAASVSDDEHKTLLHERQLLLDKKLARTITREEENRLQYVRWSLDRIEDAKFGYVLDALESSVSQYEQFLKEVRALHEQLSERFK